MKRCSACKQELPLTEFNRNRALRDGLDNNCRTCCKAQYEANREARNTYSRGQYRANIEERLAYARERRSGPLRETVLAQQRADHSRHREERLPKMRESYEANHEGRLVQVQTNRETIRAQVFAAYGTACCCCAVGSDLTIDHLDGTGAEHRASLYGHPHVGAGINFYRWLIANDFPAGFQTLCRPCNTSKRGGARCRLRHGGG